MLITTACHCGSVRILLPGPADSLTACNCSICLRYGAMWAYYRRDEFDVQCAPDAIGDYRWGEQTLAFFHCRSCGCVTHYETVGSADDDVMALNARAMWPDLLDTLPVRVFDGAVSWRYVDP